MNEHVWDQRGGAQPFDTIVRWLKSHIPARPFILAVSSILVLVMWTPGPPQPVAVLDSSPSATIPTTHPIAPGLSVDVPPGLAIDVCARCYVGPFLFSRYIPSTSASGSGECGISGVMSFASTAATPSVVRARLDSALDVGPSGNSPHATTMTVAGTPFTLLAYRSPRCTTTIAVGDFGGVTYLIALMASRTDPIVDLILRSITFSTYETVQAGSP